MVGLATVVFLVVIFCLILLWRDPRFFWCDDYQLFYGAMFEDTRRAWSEGEPPLLSPCSWVMGNPAGEHQFGTFSIFLTPCLVGIWSLPLPLPAKAAVLSVVHLAILAAGIFMLARQRKLSPPLCVMAALAGSLNGWIICWAATDWISALMSFTWVPWAWWAFEKTLSERRARWHWIMPGVFIYLVLTGGWPFTDLMLALVTLFIAIRSLATDRRLAALIPLGVGWLFGLGLSAPALIALAAHLKNSARGEWPGFFLNGWTIPWQALPGFILPSLSADWPHFSGNLHPHISIELACGLVPVVALFAALLLRRRDGLRALRWEIGLLALLVILMMMQSINPFRWSFRWLPLFHLVLALAGAEAIQLLRESSRAKWMPVVAGALVGVVWLGALLARNHFPAASIFFNGALIALSLFWLVSEFAPRFGKLREWLVVAVTFFALLTTYWWLPAHQAVGAFHFDSQITKAEPLSRERLYFSFYQWPQVIHDAQTPPEGFGALLRPGNTFAYADLRFVNGYGAFTPKGVTQIFELETHGSMRPDNAADILANDTGPRALLAFLGVDGLIVGKRFRNLAQNLWPEWQLVFSSDEADVYHRSGSPLPRICSPESLQTRPGEQFAPLRIEPIRNERQRVIVDVEPLAKQADASEDDIGQLSGVERRSSVVTFSRPWFPGYRAFFNGNPVEMQSFSDLLPMVELPANSKGRLVLEYRPAFLVKSLALAGITVLAMLLTFCFTKPASPARIFNSPPLT